MRSERRWMLWSARRDDGDVDGTEKENNGNRAVGEQTAGSPCCVAVALGTPAGLPLKHDAASLTHLAQCKALDTSRWYRRG